MRTVIFHYHLFKNAGTSLDAAFQENFAEGEWVTKEFSNNPKENREAVTQWILDNPEAKCFSSHTALLTSIKIEGVKVIPVIFIRQPFDRIASAYSFENKQGADGFGSVLARNTDLKGYIDVRLSLIHDRQCRNFHTLRFSHMYGGSINSEIEGAKKALTELPFVGIVEEYNESLIKLESLLKDEGFTNLQLKPVERNVSRNIRKPIEEKISELKNKIGAEVFKKLTEANRDDIELYNLAIELSNE